MDKISEGNNDLQRPPKKVLIVEDNKLNMILFNALLEDRGYVTLQSRTGAEALQMAVVHRPDLILMDIQLPDIPGLGLTRWPKQNDEFRATPVIAVTAFAMRGDEEKMREGGCDGYIAKPISVAGFVETVEQFLASNSTVR